jgi:hypothetical protein
VHRLSRHRAVLGADDYGQPVPIRCTTPHARSRGVAIQCAARLAVTPPGWSPEPGWRPDPSWPSALPGWHFWVSVNPLSASVPSRVPGAPGERNSRVIPQAVKIAVSVRDQGKCVQCGSADDLHFDHKVPWSRGGANTINNIQLLCGPCNRRKGADDIPF